MFGEPITDEQITSRDWNTDSELFINHEDLYAWACESENENPNFDNDQVAPDLPYSREVDFEKYQTDAETSSTPGTPLQIFPQTDGKRDGRDTDRNTNAKVETSLEKPSPKTINACSTKNDPLYNPKPNHNDPLYKKKVSDFTPALHW